MVMKKTSTMCFNIIVLGKTRTKASMTSMISERALGTQQQSNNTKADVVNANTVVKNKYKRPFYHETNKLQTSVISSITV